MWLSDDDCRVPGTFSPRCEARLIAGDAKAGAHRLNDTGAGWLARSGSSRDRGSCRRPRRGGPPVQPRPTGGPHTTGKEWLGTGTGGSIAIAAQDGDVGHALPARSVYPGEQVRKGLTRASRGCSDLYNFRGVTAGSINSGLTHSRIGGNARRAEGREVATRHLGISMFRTRRKRDAPSPEPDPHAWVRDSLGLDSSSLNWPIGRGVVQRMGQG